MSKKMRVGITHGDYNGVGYEVTLKALANEEITELFTPVLYAVPQLVEEAARRFELTLPRMNVTGDATEARDGVLNIVDLGISAVELTPGQPSQSSGSAAVAALEQAVTDVLEGVTDTIVTAPICKESVQSDSFHFPGHTEYLGDRAGATPQMILFDSHVRMALLTTHLPIAEIPAAITKERIIEAVKELHATLKQDFDIEAPKIAVLSLNPHNGDGGLLGKEEIEVIRPAVEELADAYLTFGPFAADGFFASGAWSKFDGVLAMYHDQGLAPFKALAGPEGVNFTAGLPFVRTSPDHGTAFDIAWQGVADPESMLQAIYAAIDLTRNRRRNIECAANPLPKLPEKERKNDKKEQ